MKQGILCAGLLSFAFCSALKAQDDRFPQLSDGDWISKFRYDISACWSVPSDLESTIVAAFALDQDGRVTGDVTLVEPLDPTEDDLLAFAAARRAVLRCQGDGYDLPISEYEVWKSVEIKFGPRPTSATESGTSQPAANPRSVARPNRAQALSP